MDEFVLKNNEKGVFFVVKNTLLLISLMSAKGLKSFCVEFILGYILLADVRDISKSVWCAREYT